MKIVYFGSDVFFSCFEYLAEKHEIMALYTYHNDEDFFNENRIVEKAKAHGIPVHYEELTQDQVRELFENQGCELFFIAEYDKKLPVPEDLKQFRGINVHSSLLPQGRSYYPIECAMERELPKTGVTMHKITNDLDCGDILDQRAVTITDQMDSIDIYLKNAENTLLMLQALMEDFEGTWNQAQPQGEVIPYWKRPADALLRVTHDMTVAEALGCFRKFNGMTEVILNGKIHFVFAMMSGNAMLPKPEMQVKADLWLFALADGHVRVTVLEKNQENRK